MMRYSRVALAVSAMEGKMKIFIVSFLLTFLSSVILTAPASANRMNGKGNCSGGVCTEGGTTWHPASPKKQKAVQPAAYKPAK
jgi:hypothetical protein